MRIRMSISAKIKRALDAIPLDIDLLSVNKSPHLKPVNDTRIRQINSLIKKSFIAYKAEVYKKIHIIVKKDIATYHSHKVKVDDTAIKIDNYDDYSKRKQLKNEDIVYISYVNIKESKKLDFTLNPISKYIIRYIIALFANLVVRLVMSDKTVTIDGLGTFKLKRNINKRMIPKKDGTMKLVGYNIGFTPSKDVKEKIDRECGVLYANREDIEK